MKHRKGDWTMAKDKRLPDEAYMALQALKDQAKAVAANNFAGDKVALSQAKASMAEVDSWTKAIYRKLMSSKGESTIDTIDEAWLEATFT